MSLAELIAATQAEMKTRIEEECKKQMLALLEQSFSNKWEEYTTKTIESASATPLYTPRYGKFDIEAIASTHGSSEKRWPTYWPSQHNTTIKTLITQLQFTNKNVYIIHCCVKGNYSNGSGSFQMICIDNYGFYHNISPGQQTYPIIDTTKPVQSNSKTETYIYPLPNSLIDIVKKNPYAVEPYSNNNGYGSANHGGDISITTNSLPQIRKAAAMIHEQATAVEKLLKQKEALATENEALKARIAELEKKEARLRDIEASSPTADLLGLDSIETPSNKN